MFSSLNEIYKYPHAANVQTNMESCLKFLPRTSYPWYSLVSLTIFVSTGVVIIGVTSEFESQAKLQCNPDKTLARDLSAREYMETQCFLKYLQKFYPFLPLSIVFIINFGLVLVLSTIYAYTVKRRVQIFEQQRHKTADCGYEESQPLSGNILQAAPERNKQRGSSRYFLFTVYVLHLIICRILPLWVFAALLLNSMKFPLQFHCPWPLNAISTSNANITQLQGTNVSNVHCTYPIGTKNEKISAAVVTVNLLFCTEAFIELAYLLWLSWKDRTFVSDREFCSVYLLRRRERTKKIMKRIRTNASHEVIYLQDEKSRRKLDEIYINVIIQKGRESTSTYQIQLKNRHESYHVHLEKPKDSISLSETSDLFRLMGASETLPKTILVVGRPGIGKTLLTKKILHEWKEQASEFWHGKTVILMQFRSFNNGQTSLQKMVELAHGLNMSSADSHWTYEHICSMPHNFVFIFDGLDELKYDENLLANETAVNNPNQEADVLQIFEKMVKGQLLPGVTVLATSRPTAEHIYEQLSFDQEVEILGFHKEQIKSYVEKFCHYDEDKSTKLWKVITQSPEYLSLSYIPVNCYIICLTLKEAIDADEQQKVGEESFQRNVPRTMTELYKRAINILLFRHHNEYKKKLCPKDYMNANLPEQLQNNLDRLKKIARKGMIKDQLVFEFPSGSKDVELSDCGIINKLEDKRRNLFSFLHLTIQEFLAAQHVVDDLEHVESFLIGHIDNPKWHLVIQFVAGLIGDKIRKLEKERNESEGSATDLTNEETLIKAICKRFQNRVPKFGEINHHGNKLLNMIKCVHEMQEVGVRELMTSISCHRFRIRKLSIAPSDSAALFNFFGHVKNLEFLYIDSCTVEHSAYRGLANLMKQNNKIKFLKIRFCGFSDDDAEQVIKALGNENCKVTRFELNGNYLTSESAKYLRDTLTSGHCKVTKLDLCGNNLTDVGVEYLCAALTSGECKITKLLLSSNQLSDAAAEYLRDALKNGNCKLTELNLNNNNLTDVAAERLSEAIKNDNCKLTKLFLNRNIWKDAGIKYLSDALMNRNCKLSELHLNDTGLTNKGAEYLSEALKNGNCDLTELYLLGNKELKDAGIKYLSEALVNENCKLTKLHLIDTGLTDKGAKFLSEALKNGNCNFTELNREKEELNDVGTTYSGDPLVRRNSKLTMMYLSPTWLTNEGVGYLREALKGQSDKLSIYLGSKKLNDW